MKYKERFWKKVNKTNTCWNWIGDHSNRNYDCFTFNRKTRRAHRVSALWAGIIDNIDNPNYVLHKCDNPSCVNPEHLFSGTHQDNMDDMHKKRRGKSGYYKTHCNSGHKFTKENTYLKDKKVRHCRSCKHIRERGYYMYKLLMNKFYKD